MNSLNNKISFFRQYVSRRKLYNFDYYSTVFNCTSVIDNQKKETSSSTYSFSSSQLVHVNKSSIMANCNENKILKLRSQIHQHNHIVHTRKSTNYMHFSSLKNS